MNPKTVQITLVRCGLAPHLAAIAAVDDRIPWNDDAIAACTAYANHASPEALWDLLKRGQLPPRVVQLPPRADPCPASTRDDPHTLDQCHGMHGWPALHAMTGTPCVSDPDDRFHSRCYAQLRALITHETDHAA